MDLESLPNASGAAPRQARGLAVRQAQALSEVERELVETAEYLCAALPLAGAAAAWLLEPLGAAGGEESAGRSARGDGEGGADDRLAPGGDPRLLDGEVTNAFLEGLNSLFSATKRKARGYRTTRYLVTMLYFVAGKLNIPSTILSH